MLEGLLVENKKSVCFELGHDFLVEVLHLGRSLFGSFDKGTHEMLDVFY